MRMCEALEIHRMTNEEKVNHSGKGQHSSTCTLTNYQRNPEESRKTFKEFDALKRRCSFVCFSAFTVGKLLPAQCGEANPFTVN